MPRKGAVATAERVVTLRGMGSEEHDDGARPRPDPLDRTWIHPSEARAAPLRPSRRRRDWGFTLAAGVLASLGTIGILAVMGAFGGDAGSAPRAVSAAPRATTTAVFSKVAAIAESAGPAVVAISINGAKTRCASGVAMAGPGHVVTSRSATLGASSITVIDSLGAHHDAQLIGGDAATDLAVLRVPSLGTSAPVGTTSGLHKGAMVVALGAANEVDHWHVAGVIDDLATAGRGRDGTMIPGLIGTDTDIAPTAAGGALVDDHGLVIGILVGTATASGDGPAAYALPIETADAVARGIVAHGTMVHAWLGVGAVDADPGARIESITPDGPAAAAGLRPGDVLVAAGDTVLPGADDLAATIVRRRPGTDLTVTVRRGDTRFLVRVTLAPVPADPAAPGGPNPTDEPAPASPTSTTSVGGGR